ncbi:PVC-type heme-binding CxxCH protein [Planctomyces sp. SH-PL14]|uniref:PVC-type heme-binding CxxCH protein n=1 Tax=Planctomyces sp. SH-PL14 TaxID=1632864 RepID=UPI00078D2CE1|nr:PVC-type heme-binding CxxCH protein [Planctomyces sp. SH-PL14]AMV16987.1 Cytochrome c [Planctomyces sp. SH-PL14]
MGGRPGFRAALLWTMAVLGGFSPGSARSQGYPSHEAVGRMTLPEGLTATLFASEPEVRQPIFCKCDDRGRLWTIQYLQYPNPAGLKRVQVDRFSRTTYDRKPEPPPHGPRGEDRITILEDIDGDCRADRFRDFITGLNLCTGVEFGDGGVYVIQVPYLLFYPDRNRDDVPDGDPEVLLDGFGMEDAQSLANHLTWGPDGWLYGLNGSTTTCRIRGIEFQQGVWRYHPRTRAFELFCEGGGNVYGLTFDRQGRLFYSSNGGLFWHGLQGAYYEKNFGKHGPLHNPHAYGFLPHVVIRGQTGRPNPGGTVYLGTSFPPAFRDAYLCSDFLTHTCSWWRVVPEGSTVSATLEGTLLDSHDTWFGATDLCLGPAGEVYVSDFHDQRTAHPDPDANWDRSNGRIYRIQATAAAAPPEPFDLHRLSTGELVALLRSPNGWMRDRARRLLTERRDAAAVPELDALSRDRDPDAVLQGLWALHGLEALTDARAARLLDHDSEHVRAWTVRLLGDAGRVSPEMEARLVDVAGREASVVVRSQLMSTAKRLPAATNLRLVLALLRGDASPSDPALQWLTWWAVESVSVPHVQAVLDSFAAPESWSRPETRRVLRLLVRRYAAEGTPAADAACDALWGSAPEAEVDSIVEAVTAGLRQRPRGSERGRTVAVAPGLHNRIAAAWTAQPASLVRTRLALEAGVAATYGDLLSRLAASRSGDASLLTLLAEFGDADAVPLALSFLRTDVAADVQTAALRIVGRFPEPAAVARVLETLPSLSAPVQQAARDQLLASRAGGLAYLEAVDAGRFPATSLSLEQVASLGLHADPAIDALVRRHWGQVQAATAEVKLAEVRRIQNDLRAGTGQVAAGGALFRKHCATCHRLHGEGTPLGPDLSGTARGELTSLLTNIVDPSAVIRSEYVPQVIVTTTGTVQTGLVAEQDAAAVTLVTSRNERVRIPRGEIETAHDSPVSLMPERLLSPLTPQELRDLFAFLRRPPDPSP